MKKVFEHLEHIDSDSQTRKIKQFISQVYPDIYNMICMENFYSTLPSGFSNYNYILIHTKMNGQEMIIFILQVVDKSEIGLDFIHDMCTILEDHFLRKVMPLPILQSEEMYEILQNTLNKIPFRNALVINYNAVIIPDFSMSLLE